MCLNKAHTCQQKSTDSVFEVNVFVNGKNTLPFILPYLAFIHTHTQTFKAVYDWSNLIAKLTVDQDFFSEYYCNNNDNILLTVIVTWFMYCSPLL